MFSEQTCTIVKKSNQSLWQTTELFDILHPSDMWIQTVFHVGNTAKQCRLGLFQDADFAEDLEDSKIHLWRNIMRFWNSYICSDKWDVYETNIRFTHFNRIRNHLFGRWFEIRRASCSRIVGSDCFCFGKHDSDYRENGATCHWQKSKISREDQRAE